MGRRTFVAAIASLSATNISPAFGATLNANIEATDILRLFHKYQVIINAADKHVCDTDGTCSDKEIEHLFYQHSDKIVANIMALPCTCAGDFAAKIIIDTCRGVLISDWDSGMIWQEARTLVNWPNTDTL